MEVEQLEQYPLEQRETHRSACIGITITQTGTPPNQP
jgi:hypothetical protein